ncbi:S-layer homology domain-containing protein [Paenibacillus radicis (ex Gao et al. 2016)]|uniref:S-layer homology domain-containing protein n=1 Tax=Paenibacillus radicis (ex Gao et al. 2016) TaxID=1737354 RepID=UPI0016693865|nr:S-layer homology domain-containing protein [Paenibacillus radicis (ex Gao et al. 2016)]
MFRKQARKRISMLLALAMVLSIFSTNYFAFAAETTTATTLSDIDQSYAKAEIAALVEKGILAGFTDGTFKPGDSLTRAQLAKVLVLSLNKEEDLSGAASFKDVASSDWFAGYVGALVKSGITQGTSASSFSPNQTVTREELAVFFIRAFGWEEQAKATALETNLSDLNKVSVWAKPHVSFAYKIGFIKGSTNNDGSISFNPSGKADRQALARLAYEFVVNRATYVDKVSALNIKQPEDDKKPTSPGGNNGSGTGPTPTPNPETTTTISEPGTRSLGTVNGNVVISAADVTLKDTTINGNLTLTSAIGLGDVTLDNVTVTGTTNVQGGGPNSIHVSNSILATVVVNKSDGSIRLVLENGTDVQQVELRSGGIIQTNNAGEIGPIGLASTIPQNATVTLNGSFDTVNVNAQQINISLADGTSVGDLNVFAGAVNNAFQLYAGSSVTHLIVNAITSFAGAGIISSAQVNVDDVDFSGLTTPPVMAADPSVTEVVYSPKSFTLSAVGATRQIVLTGVREQGNIDLTQIAAWSSSTPSVAEVVYGVVKAVGDGTTTISANYGSYNIEVPVTVSVYQPVTHPTITGIVVTNGQIDVQFDQTVEELSLEHFKVTASLNGVETQLRGLNYSNGQISFQPISTYGKTLYVTVQHDENFTKFAGSQSGSIKLTGFGGKITNVLNQAVSNLTIKFRKGLNATTGDVVATVTTDAYGKYFVNLPAGIYTGEIGGEGTDYIKSYLIGVAASNVSNTNENFTAIKIPLASETRIVLTWGKAPRDLDSHLIGPAVDGEGQFHTWYWYKKYTVNGELIVDLDWDDVDSYGPETTTLRKNVPGTYLFYVHNYSNESPMTASGAKVQVIQGTDWENPIEFTIPTGADERYWLVFEFTIDENGVITFNPINKLTNDNPASGRYVNETSFEDDLEEEEL